MLNRRDAYTERCNEVNVSMSSPKKKTLLIMSARLPVTLLAEVER
jgi:hypothetical protein